MTTKRKLSFATLQIHGGYEKDKTTGSTAVPIYQTASYQFKDTQHAANLFALKEFGNIYTRLMNPTTQVLEDRLALLDGGAAGLAASSGHAAQSIAIFSICSAGDHIVSTSKLYGGTFNQFKYTLAKLGISTTFVDPSDPQNFAKAIKPNTKVIYGETIGNPDVSVFPIEEVAKIAKEHGIPLIIDNTLATPYLFKPLQWGANIVSYSTTKFLNGHGNSIGGAIVDGNNFDWSNPRFTEFNTPDPSYHGLVYSSLAGAGLPPFIIKARVQILRDLGASQSPINSWLTVQGIETLSVRMAQHVANAQKVAEFLEAHAQVSFVNYPSLKSSPHYNASKKYFPNGCGAVLSFGIKGGIESGKKFIENLKIFSHVANVGDVRSLAIHPASTTHSQLSKDDLKSAGTSEDLIRLSIGLEDIDDILWDIDQALAESRG